MPTTHPAVLVVDIGGSRVKLFASASRDTASFPSGTHFGPDELMRPLPPETRRGHNDDAFAGGVRLWEDWVEHHDTPPSDIWRVVW